MDNPALIYGINTIAHRKRRLRVLLDQQDREAFAPHSGHELHHHLPNPRCKALGRLVQQQEAWRAQQRSRDCHHLGFTTR